MGVDTTAANAKIVHVSARPQHETPQQRPTDRGAVDRPEYLSLITGLLGDRREPIHRDNGKLYPAAERLWREQETWGTETHATVFSVVLDWWPQRRGAASLHDLQAVWVAALRQAGFSSSADLAYVLDVKPETIRDRRLGGFADLWVDEVLRDDGTTPRFRPSRCPVVVDEYHEKPVLNLRDPVTGLANDVLIGNVVVNLPTGYRRTWHESRRKADPRSVEDGYMRRFAELRFRRRAA